MLLRVIKFKLELIVSGLILVFANTANAEISSEESRSGVFEVTVNAAGELATAIANDELSSASTIILKTATGVYLNEDDVNALIVNGNSLVTNGTLKSLNLENAKCSYTLSWSTDTYTWDNVLTSSNIQYLENFTYPKYMVNIPVLGGGNTKNLKKIIIPEKDSSDDTKFVLAQAAFQNVSQLEYLEINNNVDEVPDNLCMGLQNLKDVELRCPVQKIGNYAFCNCKSLMYLSLPEGLEVIGTEAFNNCNIIGIRMPSTLKTIEASAFKDCANLEEIVIPQNVESIGSSAFLGCNSLKDVYVKNAQTAICYNSFNPDGYCTNIQSQYIDAATVNRDSYWNPGADGAYKRQNGQILLHIYDDKSNQANQNLIAEFDARYKGTKELNGHTMYNVVNTTTGVHWPSVEDGQIVDANIKYGAEDYNANPPITTTTADARNWQRFVLADVYTSNDEWVVPHVIDDTWYTICVPFNVTRNQVQSAFGATTEVCRFDGVKDVSKSSCGSSAHGITFTSDLMTADGVTGSTVILQKGIAYMIHPSTHTTTSNSTGTSGIFTVTGVTVDSECEPSATTDDNGYSFIGTFTNGNLSEHVGSYFLAVQSGEKYPKFFRATSKSKTWTAFTAIVTPPSSENAKNMSIFIGDESIDNDRMIIEGTANVTAINHVTAENILPANANTRVYNLQGVYVGNSLNGLNSGLYIINGKKYVVR